MKYKLGIYGSSAGDMKAVMPKALELGRVLRDYADQVIVITGACAGLPYVVAAEAHKGGVEIWGYSAEFDLKELTASAPDDDHSIYKKITFAPTHFPLATNRRARMKYRNVISAGNCDAGIIISGRWGSLNEFTNLIDMQKTAGLLTGTGGVADELSSLSKKISKEGQGTVLADDDPKALVDKILNHLKA